MIDIHRHILPGVDDGAKKSLEIAIKMLRMAVAAGTPDIVVSPHANQDYCFDLRGWWSRHQQSARRCG